MRVVESVVFVSLVLAPPAGAGALSARAQSRQPEGSICADPGHPCDGFKPHDLSFVLPAGSRARPDIHSAPFYAVILKSGARCAVTEAERLGVQREFPDVKVFATRFECDDNVENNVSYTGVDTARGFLAVYGGATAAEAKAVLARVQATGRYPGANVRQLRVVFATP